MSGKDLCVPHAKYPAGSSCGAGAAGAGRCAVDELLLDLVDPAGDACRVRFRVVALGSGVGLAVEDAGVDESLIRGSRGVVDAFLLFGCGVGPAYGFQAGQQVVLAGHDQVPELVEDGRLCVGLVAVAERVAPDPVAVALLDVGVVVVLVGAAPGHREFVSVSPRGHTPVHELRPVVEVDPGDRDRRVGEYPFQDAVHVDVGVVTDRAQY